MITIIFSSKSLFLLQKTKKFSPPHALKKIELFSFGFSLKAFSTVFFIVVEKKSSVAAAPVSWQKKAKELFDLNGLLVKVYSLQLLYTTYRKRESAITLDILFPSNHNIHKSSCGLVFWASDPLINRF